MLVSVYLWHSEGLSARNEAILAAIGEVIRGFGRPAIIGGDFNMEPQQLQEHFNNFFKMFQAFEPKIE